MGLLKSTHFILLGELKDFENYTVTCPSDFNFVLKWKFWLNDGSKRERSRGLKKTFEILLWETMNIHIKCYDNLACPVHKLPHNVQY